MVDSSHGMNLNIGNKKTPYDMEDNLFGDNMGYLYFRACINYDIDEEHSSWMDLSIQNRGSWALDAQKMM